MSSKRPADASDDENWAGQEADEIVGAAMAAAGIPRTTTGKGITTTRTTRVSTRSTRGATKTSGSTTGGSMIIDGSDDDAPSDADRKKAERQAKKDERARKKKREMAEKRKAKEDEIAARKSAAAAEKRELAARKKADKKEEQARKAEAQRVAALVDDTAQVMPDDTDMPDVGAMAEQCMLDAAVRASLGLSHEDPARARPVDPNRNYASQNTATAMDEDNDDFKMDDAGRTDETLGRRRMKRRIPDQEALDTRARLRAMDKEMLVDFMFKTGAAQVIAARDMERDRDTQANADRRRDIPRGGARVPSHSAAHAQQTKSTFPRTAARDVPHRAHFAEATGHPKSGALSTSSINRPAVQTDPHRASFAEATGHPKTGAQPTHDQSPFELDGVFYGDGPSAFPAGIAARERASSPFEIFNGPAREAEAVAEAKLERLLAAGRSNLSRTINPLAQHFGIGMTGDRSGDSTVEHLLHSHEQLQARGNILRFNDEFTRYGRTHGASLFPSNAYISMILNEEYSEYKAVLTNKVLSLAKPGSKKKASEALTPKGIDPAFEYMPLLVILEQIKHVVRREAEIYTKDKPAMRDSFKAWAWPRAMMAMQHAVMFCMVYPMHAHFEVVERLGRSAVVCNKSMDVLYIVRKTLDEVSKLQHCRRTRDGFYVGANWVQQQYPGMSTGTSDTQQGSTKAKKNKKNMNQNKRDNARRKGGNGRQDNRGGNGGGRGGHRGGGRGGQHGGGRGGHDGSAHGFEQRGGRHGN